MALAVLSVPHFLGPLQSLWSWISQPQAAPSPRIQARTAIQPAARPAPLHIRRARPLRVVRVVEPSQALGGAGRMVISGRMADVCAELDRLAAREAQQR
ncbi:hypothetical protein FN976_16520 [Caenimonas sedimenti]|uniref:Uncharacterized protein n=1 Tax=Caenimonas sedimenti TaxID=2596921 RepID=A0A562ZNK9_9BURK|nr:hypothetical protein [Caenimonas sedimenti]TWO69951.1 hypothetical protein FN976_16520 [Caenimonas sedimenti]